MWFRHFIEDRTETQSSQETCPDSHGGNSGLDLDFPVPIEILSCYLLLHLPLAHIHKGVVVISLQPFGGGLEMCLSCSAIFLLTFARQMLWGKTMSENSGLFVISVHGSLLHPMLYTERHLKGILLFICKWLCRHSP